jgi:carbon monoxide dehydrogenase subunit G
MELSNEFVVPVGVDEAWVLLTDVERIAPCMPGAELQEIEGEEYRGIVKVKVGPITAQYKGKATFIEKDDAAHKAVLKAEGRDTRGQGNANATITATLTAEGDGTRVSVVTDLAITGRAAQFGRGVMADVSTKLLGQFVDCLEKNVLSGEAAAPAAQAGAGAAPATEAAQAASGAVGSPEAAQAASGTGASGGAAAGEGAGETQQEAPAEVGAGRASATGGGGGGPAAPVTREPGGASDAALAGGTSGTNGSSSGQATVSSGPRQIVSRPAEPVDLLGTAGSPVLKRLLPAVAGALLAFLVGRRLRRWRRS